MYRRNNQLASYWYSKTRYSKNKIGKKVSYDLNDSISIILNYNNKGEKHGKFSAWFDNRNKSDEGRYLSGKKEGLWRSYFYGGEIAAKSFFKNDSLITEKFYDQNGNEKQLKEKCCEKKPQFKGGLKKYKKIAQKFLDRKKYKIQGTVTVDYTISVTGDLTNVRIYDILPDNIDDKIITFFKQIKGWNPACNKGRAVPIQHSFKLIFN
jgi:antitoxin component YwqK of YwqJK toxin-antitoxin module